MIKRVITGNPEEGKSERAKESRYKTQKSKLSL